MSMYLATLQRRRMCINLRKVKTVAVLLFVLSAAFWQWIEHNFVDMLMMLVIAVMVIIFNFAL